MRTISYLLHNSLIIMSCLFLMLFSSCISSKKYSDMEVLKEYYKLKGDTLTMAQSQNRSLQSELNKTKSELKLTSQRLQATQKALDLSEEKFANLNRNYAELQASSEQISAKKESESTAMKGQIMQLQAQNDAMKAILSSLDASYQVHLNGAVVSNDNWNDKLSRMQEISELIDAENSQLSALHQVLASNAIFQEDGFEVLQSSEGVVIRLLNGPIFREGKTQLNTKGRNTIEELTGVIMRNSNLDVFVEGHTDGQGSVYSNWNVSLLRAGAVVKHMIKCEMRPSRLQAIGRSSHKRLAFEDTDAARKMNRRVEIIIRPRTYQ